MEVDALPHRMMGSHRNLAANVDVPMLETEAEVFRNVRMRYSLTSTCGSCGCQEVAAAGHGCYVLILKAASVRFLNSSKRIHSSQTIGSVFPPLRTYTMNDEPQIERELYALETIARWIRKLRKTPCEACQIEPADHIFLHLRGTQHLLCPTCFMAADHEDDFLPPS